MKRSDIKDKEILDICYSFHKRQTATPDIVLKNKYPQKVILSKMQQLVDKGILDYGVSLRTAWVVNY